MRPRHASDDPPTGFAGEVVVRPLSAENFRAGSRVHWLSWTDAYRGIYPDWFIDERNEQFFHGLWQAFLEDDMRPVRPQNARELDLVYISLHVPYGRGAARLLESFDEAARQFGIRRNYKRP